MKEDRVEYGDWQTSYDFAKQVCLKLKSRGVSPRVLVEPTCGKGNFIAAAIDVFPTIQRVYAIEIYDKYIEEVKLRFQDIPDVNFHFYNESIFDFDFDLLNIEDSEVLVLGNPPWVTNSHLGTLGSANIPEKSNFKKYKGFQALTGKGNFDIAEYILLTLIKAFSNNNGNIAMLVKNSVVKNIIEGHNKLHIADIQQYEFDCKKEFGASTSASLFFAKFSEKSDDSCKVFDFYSNTYRRTIGVVNNRIIYNLDKYSKLNAIDGRSPLQWRSGIKHDCSSVMELSYTAAGYVNKDNAVLDIEDEYVYPLLKSSDIKKQKINNANKCVLVTQKTTSSDTCIIQKSAPKTYNYLIQNSEKLDARKSIIYKKKPRFCIFGIGDYSFKPYKVAISALYKHTQFSYISTVKGKPVMLDDTCYLIGFEDEEYAYITMKLLNSEVVQSFINAVSFSDSKRIINSELLMRIDLIAAAELIENDKLEVDFYTYERYKKWLLSNKMVS